MDRAYQSGAAVSAPSAPASPSTGYPTAGNPGSGTPATAPGPYWYHMIMEELMAVISAAGIEPAQGNLTQLLTALRSAGVFQTAPQFDNDTSVATTAFVQRALGSFSGVSVLNGATALTAGDVGKNIILSGSSAFATTLPATAGLPNGAAISIENNANVDCTVVRSGGDVISPNSSSAISTITIPAGTQITFVKAVTTWYAFGSGAAAYQSNFGSSLAANGYQKLPSGLIIQWGEVSQSSGTEGSTSITFPIAFPNACLQVIPGLDGGTWNTMNQFNLSAQTLGKTASGFTYYLQMQATTSGAGTYKLTYIAIGY